jgi:hypothetical protein
MNVHPEIFPSLVDRIKQTLVALKMSFPYRRFAAALAGVRARLRVDADRYSLIVSDFHRLRLAGLSSALRKNLHATNAGKQHNCVIRRSTELDPVV